MGQREDEQQQAAERATADELFDGVIHDAHGEIQLDPNTESVAALVERQRDNVEAVETHNEQADDETRGSVDDPPRPTDQASAERKRLDRPDT